MITVYEDNDIIIMKESKDWPHLWLIHKRDDDKQMEICLQNTDMQIFPKADNHLVPFGTGNDEEYGFSVKKVK